MSGLVDIHPTLRLDHTVERKNESHHHWAVKAVVVDILRSDPEYVGEIETEKKTGELIGDIRCDLSESPPDVPSQIVVEIETPASDKDRLQATADHLRHGYAVYWVFTVDAADDRLETEELLSEYLSSQPSLGVASLADGELSLGAPITWHEFAYKPPWLGRTELQIPTYDRFSEWYNHGDFQVDDQRVSIYRQVESSELFVSEYVENGQQTLPQRTSLDVDEVGQGIQEGNIKRQTPVRGSP